MKIKANKCTMSLTGTHYFREERVDWISINTDQGKDVYHTKCEYCGMVKSRREEAVDTTYNKDDLDNFGFN